MAQSHESLNDKGRNVWHVSPVEDWLPHNLDMGEDLTDCHCDPEVRYIDPDTGLPYPDNGVIIVHNAFDGRE